MCSLIETLTTLHVAVIGLHGPSWHSSEFYNNFTPGAYVRTECDVQVGSYYNSVKNPTVYISKVWQIEETPFAISTGISTGYAEYPIPFGTGILKIDEIRKEWHLPKFRIVAIPKIRSINDTWVFHLVWETSFRKTEAKEKNEGRVALALGNRGDSLGSPRRENCSASSRSFSRKENDNEEILWRYRAATSVDCIRLGRGSPSAS